MLVLFVFNGIPSFGQSHYNKIFHLIDSADYVFAQPSDLQLIDSTLILYHNAESDTERIDYLNHIINNCYNDLVWPAYNDVMYEETKSLLSSSKMTDPNWSFKVASLHAMAVNNMGYLEYYQGNIEGALIYYQQSLKISERIEDSVSISMCYNNMGGVFYSTGDFEKSIAYFKKSLDIKYEYAQPSEIAISISNIGSVYNQSKKLDSANHYYNKALSIYEKINDKEGLALCYHNIASINSKQGHSELANLFFLKSIRISEGINDYAMVANSYLLLSKLYFELKDLKKAEKYGLRSLEYAEKLGFPAEIGDASEILLKIYKALGNNSAAVKMYDQFVLMKDSVMSVQTRQEIENQELTFQFEKKAYADSLKHVEENKINRALIAEQKSKIKADRLQKFSLFAGIVLLLIIAVIIMLSLRNNKRAQKEIALQNAKLAEQYELTEDQREKLEEKNKEIVDSINYAKRLQEGILPSKETIEELLPNSFILYLPKDIVAGDFYWMTKVNDLIYFAVADCTGHGVPGAFVSIICSNALTATLDQEGIEPHEILEQTTNKIEAAFNQSNHDIMDGMDIALCVLNPKTLELKYSGAYNPLWIATKRKDLGITTQVHESGHDVYLHEIKATKQPVGKYTFKRPFEIHTLQLKKGEQLYLSSDGYPDQFGGEKGKKLKYKQFKSMILSYSTLSTSQQYEALKDGFYKWKGDFEQIDDVCVMGILV